MRPVIVTLVIAGALLTAGGCAIRSVATSRVFGRGQPQYRQAAAQRRDEARERFFGWRDSLWRIEDELEGNARSLRAELGNGRTYLLASEHVQRDQRPRVFGGEVRKLVDDAYRKTAVVNEQAAKRRRELTQETVDDPEWLALREDEVRAHEEALEAVLKAQAAVRNLRESAEAP